MKDSDPTAAPTLPVTPEAVQAATGRSLDALVAEHVLGWRWTTFYPGRRLASAELLSPRDYAQYGDQGWAASVAGRDPDAPVKYDQSPHGYGLQSVPMFSTTFDLLLWATDHLVGTAGVHGHRLDGWTGTVRWSLDASDPPEPSGTVGAHGRTANEALSRALVLAVLAGARVRREPEVLALRV